MLEKTVISTDVEHLILTIQNVTYWLTDIENSSSKSGAGDTIISKSTPGTVDWIMDYERYLKST